MATSFFFYDLETSGVRPAKDRIMQFGGQRTDLNLKLLGKPINLNIALTPDILPNPEAIVLSGISPLKNIKEGITEAKFTDIFNNAVAIPGTIFVGFNNLRFDDEFIRYSNYRNFYDAYSWHWQNSSSRWDILDVVRMTRALRPEGINWPFNDQSKPSNKLEHLTQANNLKHQNAHDALSDTLATIEVARLIKDHQPKLFNYLLSIRAKAKLTEVIKDNEALVYTSSHYPSSILHTTVVAVIDFDPEKGTALVFDLRHNPKDYIDLSIEELTALWEYDPDASVPRLPVKTMKLNRCPAIAPLSVLEPESLSRLELDMTKISEHIKSLEGNKKQLAAKLKKVAVVLDNKRQQRRASQPRIPTADERLYDSFIPKADTALFKTAHERAKLTKEYMLTFSDKRLNALYSLYRAHNYPNSLTKQEQTNWHKFIYSKLFNGPESYYDQFSVQLKDLKVTTKDQPKLKLLKDTEDYAKAILIDYGSDLPEQTV